MNSVGERWLLGLVSVVGAGVLGGLLGTLFAVWLAREEVVFLGGDWLQLVTAIATLTTAIAAFGAARAAQRSARATEQTAEAGFVAEYMQRYSSASMAAALRELREWKVWSDDVIKTEYLNRVVSHLGGNTGPPSLVAWLWSKTSLVRCRARQTDQARRLVSDFFVTAHRLRRQGRVGADFIELLGSLSGWQLYKAIGIPMDLALAERHGDVEQTKTLTDEVVRTFEACC